MLSRLYFLVLFLLCYMVSPSYSQDEFEWEEVELNSKIAYEYVSDFFFDYKQYLWISSHRGLYRVNGFTSKYYVFNPNADNSLITNIIYNCYVDHDKQLWILTDNGIQEYRYETDDFEVIMQSFLDSTSSEYRKSCTSAIQLDEEHMLFGSKEGAIRYNKKTQEYSYYPIQDPIIPDGFSSNAHVLNMKGDKRNSNRIIIYTLDGFYYYLKTEDRLEKAFEDPDIDLTQRKYYYKHLETTEQGFYFTALKAVYFYEFATKSYQEITIPWKEVRPSISNVHIRNFILVEKKLYISTMRHGIYEVEIENDHKVRLLTNGYFNQIALDPQARLWVVEQQTLLRSKAAVIDKVAVQQYLDLEEFKVNSKPVELNSMSIKLRNFERHLSGSIALINPETSKSVNYFYKLEPDEKHWVPIDSSRKFEFINLKPGIKSLQFKSISGKGTVLSSPLHLHLDRFFYEEWWFKLLVFSTVLFFLASIYFLIQSKRREREKHRENMLHMELNALRSQMNPHFLFNTLNSIKNFMLTKNPDEAGDYLTKFSQLIRCILENSKSQFLTLDQELKAINLYVKMEQLRFDDGFKYELNIDQSIDVETFKVAPMLIQPFIENAIWHGLMPKKNKRELYLEFSPYEKGVKCIVRDNGIGRAASEEMYKNRKESKNSLGLKITAERISNINLLYNIKVKLQIDDLSPSGTQVSIFLPYITKLS